MSADYSMRLFASDDAVRHVATGMMECALPMQEWTHEAHFAATIYLLRDRPDVLIDVELPGMIKRYNISAGGENTDTGGYHETITRFYIALMRWHLTSCRSDESLVDAVNSFLRSPRAERAYPLEFYSRERLFSVEARRNFVTPDLVDGVTDASFQAQARWIFAD